jgi:phosphoglycerate dehydrogenase-like enzyme
MRVVYTDPPWALDEDGRVDAGLADIERAILGAGVEISLGRRTASAYSVDGRGLHESVRGADAVVVYRCEVTADLLDAVGLGCRVVARQGVGLETLNANLLHERGIWGFHVPDYCGDEVSSHALALALALERGVCAQDRLVKAKRWNIHAGGVPRRTSELTAGIVGFGRIGRATARKAQPFYREIQVYDPEVPPDVMASHGVRSRDSLESLVAGADHVFLHAALTPANGGMIDAEALRGFRPDALLINTARGRLVDVAAVRGALEDNRLGGFASDVFTPEDPNLDPDARALLVHPRVIVTAHRAFLSDVSERSLRRRVAQGIAHVLRTGEPPVEGRVA